MAIGIIAFAFVAIFALLPVGMGSFRKALDTSITTQIAQRIVNEAKQTDFATLTANSTTAVPPRYFDEQGDEATVADRWLYIAQLTVHTPTTLPGSAAGPSSNLATVTVKIAANPGRNADPFNPEGKVRFSTYSTFVARNQ